MEWNEEAVARLRELWAQGLSTAEIGRHLNVTKNAVVGKAHRLGLEGRPSPIRRSAAKKEKTASDSSAKTKVEIKAEVKVEAKTKDKIDDKVVKAEKVEKPAREKITKVEKVVKAEKAEKDQSDLPLSPVKAVQTKPVKKTKIEFSTPMEMPKRRSLSDCCWPIGDPGNKDFHFCGAKAIPGKPYCLEHVQVAYVKLRDRKNNVA